MKQRLLRYSFAMALLLVAMNLQAVALESQIANATVTWYSDVAGEKAITSAAPRHSGISSRNLTINLLTTSSHFTGWARLFRNSVTGAACRIPGSPPGSQCRLL